MPRRAGVRGTARWVALLRGVNVGRAKRIAMADLRAVVESLGYGDVKTLLNSGNVVFTGPPTLPPAAGTAIERTITERLGVVSRVTLLAAAELDAIIAANPLTGIADDPSRLHVAVLGNDGLASRLAPLAGQDWTPEVIALGARAAYLWCPAGLSGGKLGLAVDRTLRDGVTMRNWATTLKLQTLAAS